MKSKFKLKLATYLFLFFQLAVYSQDTEKVVEIIVSGIGKTLEEAKQSAIKSSVKQVFETFISSQNQVFNNSILSSEITSTDNGNIKSFEMLNESQLPDNRWGVTYKAKISVSKLRSFAVLKGIPIEIKNEEFVYNIKQQKLREQSEINAISEMVGLLHENMQLSFDYEITSGQPKSLDAGSTDWSIPIEVKALTNKNIDLCANYCINTLASISLSPEEITSFESSNKKTISVTINYKDVENKFYLIKETSYNALVNFADQWNFYTKLFVVESGIDEIYDIKEDEVDYFDFYKFRDGSREINFQTAGQQAAKFKWHNKRTMSQIENMTGYKVKSRGIISPFNHGGFVVYEKNGHGLVLSLNLEYESKIDWYSAKKVCTNLILNGYNDWHVPTKEEINEAFTKLGNMGIEGLRGKYWTSSEFDTNSAFIYNCLEARSQDGVLWYYTNNHESFYKDYDWYMSLRLVRNF